MKQRVASELVTVVIPKTFAVWVSNDVGMGLGVLPRRPHLVDVDCQPLGGTHSPQSVLRLTNSRIPGPASSRP